MEEAKRKKYYDLRYRLSHHVLKGTDDHQRLMSTAGAKGLTAVEQHPPNFTNICDVFDRKGLLGPEKLGILKEIFPRDKNDKAYDDIVKTEKEISGGQNQGSSDGNRQPGSSGQDQFARGYMSGSSDGSRQPDSTDLVGKPFHKKTENVFYYKDAKPYFKADIDASIGLIKIAGEHGTCFRIGDKYIMTAFHVVKKHLNNGKLPPPLTLDRAEPSSYVDIFGYPGEHILQVDMRCPICDDLEVKIKEAVSYWMTEYPDDPEKSAFDKGFEILKYRTALHSSKTFEDGASGGPIARLDKGRPVVTMMYQGGTPSFYYKKYPGTTHPMQHRIEYGISMRKVDDILEDNCQQLIKDNIFQ